MTGRGRCEVDAGEGSEGQVEMPEMDDGRCMYCSVKLKVIPSNPTPHLGSLNGPENVGHEERANDADTNSVNDADLFSDGGIGGFKSLVISNMKYEGP